MIDRATGELFLKNPGAASEMIDGYSFFSPGASLLTGNLTSIGATYDVSGDQSVDATAEWFFLSLTDSSIAEVSSVSLSGSLDPGEVVSLGNIWSVGDLEALFVTLSAGVTTADSFGLFRDLEADYDNDLDVDLDDLAVYNATFGSTTLLDADGNNDGVVNAIDYAVWRESPELSLTTSLATAPPPLLQTAAEIGVGEASVSSIPEPSSGLLLLLAVAAWGRRSLFE